MDGDAPMHTLECGHSFHCSCICTWFRQGYSTCPMCRDTGNEHRLNFPDSAARASALRRRARNKNAPNELKRLVARLQTAEQRFKDVRKEMSSFRKEHTPIFKKWNAYRPRLYAASRMVRQRTRELGTYSSPDCPLPNIRYR